MCLSSQGIKCYLAYTSCHAAELELKFKIFMIILAIFFLPSKRAMKEESYIFRCNCFTEGISFVGLPSLSHPYRLISRRSVHIGLTADHKLSSNFSKDLIDFKVS